MKAFIAVILCFFLCTSLLMAVVEGKDADMPSFTQVEETEEAQWQQIEE